INHAADGGIYAELVRNRSFEDSAEEPVFWEPFTAGDGGTEIALETENLLNDVQKQCLHVVTKGEGGVSNAGFWGINAVKGKEYKLSLWMKLTDGEEFTAMLTDSTRTRIYASATLDIDKENLDWQHIKAELQSSANDSDAILVIASNSSSDFCLDMVSLFPPTYKNHPNGLRADLAEMLEELHPAFMRFPGGCFVEGRGTPDNAFRWERTIGPIEERPGHDNTNWGYRTSDGLGFHEYLQLAEDINAEPLYVCNIGIWHGGVTPLEETGTWVEECLNALEYANGLTTSKYGALRAQNGHPEPFNLKYIEIGNENNQDDGGQESDHYYERYKLFRDAILEKYPETIIIGNVAAWGGDEPRWHVDDPVELVDEHYYRSPDWFAAHFKKYDAYDRTQPSVYCGEYAVIYSFGDLGNLNAALGEAIYMMGFENNSDIVKMSSYAPIFVNENDACWKPDMIRFNGNSVMGTPSYYVQKLMADNLGHRTIKMTEGNAVYFDDEAVNEKAAAESVLAGIFTSASINETGDEIILKIVNTSSVAETATLDFGSFKTSGGELIQLKATDGMAENTLQSPTNVYPVTRHISLDPDGPKFDIPPYSLNILKLPRLSD
ncbi:MAG: arabinosidase, partial [Bacteroidales bacterium]|nr:arabinosidase [Bacteroidales bacterium]